MSSPTQATANGSPQLEQWREILRNATKEVFSMMVGAHTTDPENGDPAVLTEITGMVGLAGELCGVLTIRCSAKSSAKIASRMLGVDIAQAADHQSDAVGEMCNMVAGNFKAKVAGLEDKCLLSVPTVITGPDYEIHSLEVGERIEISLIFEGEPVWVSLEVRN
jgi:chemotaxis protein CheX